MKKLLKWGCLIFIIAIIISIVLSAIKAYGEIGTFLGTKEEIKKSIVEQSEKVPAITKRTLKFVEPIQPIKEEKEILNFKSLSEKKVGLRSQNRAIQKILVITPEEHPSKDLMKNTAISIWEENLHYNEFTIFIYLEGMDTSASAYCVVEFNKQGITDFIVFD